MSTLDKIADHQGTDKSSLMHNYCIKYEKYLPFHRYDTLKILEIGVLRGESLRTWKEYFYRSEIIGIDINPDCKVYEEDRIHIEIGSQVDVDFLNTVSAKYGPFDMILDDGSHYNSHQIGSFEYLFKTVKPSGVYIVEDSVTSYWPEFEGGYLKSDSTMEYFKKLTDDINFRGIKHSQDGLPPNNYRKEISLIPYTQIQIPDCRVDIESINFLNSIIIITKR